jgi:hypothetical protein
MRAIAFDGEVLAIKLVLQIAFNLGRGNHGRIH